MDYSNLHVRTMSKRIDTGLVSGPEPQLLLDQKAVQVRPHTPLYLFSDSSLQGLLETFRLPHSPLKPMPNPSCRAATSPLCQQFFVVQYIHVHTFVTVSMNRYHHYLTLQLLETLNLSPVPPKHLPDFSQNPQGHILLSSYTWRVRVQVNLSASSFAFITYI